MPPKIKKEETPLIDTPSDGVYTASSAGLSSQPSTNAATTDSSSIDYKKSLRTLRDESKYNITSSRLAARQAEAQAESAKRIAEANALSTSYANNSNTTNSTSSDSQEVSTTSETTPTTTQEPAPVYTPPTLSALQGTGFEVKDASTYNTPETSVAYQLSQLLSSNSPYMKQVDAKSKLTANSLGMLSSDRFLGAAAGAAIREGLPIATADAATASKFGLQQQQADNNLANVSLEGLVSGNLQTQKGDLDVRLANIQGEISKSLANLNNAANKDLANVNNAAALERLDLTNKANLALAELNNKFQSGMQDTLLASNMKQNALNSATSQINNSTVSIENMLKDPDILQLGPEAVQNLIANQIDLMSSGIKLTYGLADLDMDTYVEDMIGSYSDKFNYQTAPAFDEVAYMQAKAAQLNATNYQGKTWDAASAAEAIRNAGMTAQEHYDLYGKYEGITI